MSKFTKIWWGRRFLEGLEAFTEAGRLARGRHYLGGQRIVEWEVRGSVVTAKVRGRVSPYYGVYEEPIYDARIEFAPVPDAAWDQAIRLIGTQAGFVSRLLFNEMPDEIETPLAELGVDLLPRGQRDIHAWCSCPDEDAPCKHIAGIYHLLAAKLDHDPFLLFELRGLSHAELARRLKTTPLGSALASALTENRGELRPAAAFFSRPERLPLPERVTPREFWRGAKRLPPGVEPPPPVAVSGILIRKGGDYPAFWDKDESFVEVMDTFYEQVRKKAKECL